MFSTGAAAYESAAGGSSRQRRRAIEPPRRFDTRSTVAQQSHLAAAVARQVSRNPTRRLPDYIGIDELSKIEIKKDMRNIEISSSFVFDNGEEDMEEDGGNAMIMRSMRPPSAPESNILSKKRRYATWATDPNQMSADLNSYRNTVSHLQREVRSVESEQDRWYSSFELASQQLNNSINSCKLDNETLATDGKYLKTLCSREVMLMPSQKTRTTFIRDVVHELDSRRDRLGDLFGEYEALLQQMSHKLPAEVIPVTHIELDEKTGETFDPTAKDVAPSGGVDEVKEQDIANSKRCLRTSDEKDAAAGESIYDAFVTMEDHLRHSETLLGDIDSLWPDDRNGSWKAFPGADIERKAAAPFTSIKTDVGWGNLIDTMCSTSANDLYLRRKKKDNNEQVVSIKSFVHPRTPRGVPLILSPIGQCGDRYVGMPPLPSPSST